MSVLFATRLLLATEKGVVIWNMETRDIEEQYYDPDGFKLCSTHVILPKEAKSNYICVKYTRRPEERVSRELRCVVFCLDMQKKTCKFHFFSEGSSSPIFWLEGTVLNIHRFNDLISGDEDSKIDLSTSTNGSHINF